MRHTGLLLMLRQKSLREQLRSLEFRAETTSRSTAAPPNHSRSPVGCGWKWQSNCLWRRFSGTSYL